MSARNYPLQALVDLRQRIVDLARQQVSAANEAVKASEIEVARHNEQLVAARTELDGLCRGGALGAQRSKLLQLHQRRVEAARHTVAECHRAMLSAVAERDAAVEQAEAAQAALVTAATELSTVERHRDRFDADEVARAEKAAEEELDEFAARIAAKPR